MTKDKKKFVTVVKYTDCEEAEVYDWYHEDVAKGYLADIEESDVEWTGLAPIKERAQ